MFHFPISGIAVALKLFFHTIETPLGAMIAVGDENSLYFLDFMDQDDLPADFPKDIDRALNMSVLDPNQPIQNMNNLSGAWIKLLTNLLLKIAQGPLNRSSGEKLKNSRLERLEDLLKPGLTPPLASIQKEIQAYFAGSLTTFSTPTVLQGSVFQEKAWSALKDIPYGTTQSYKQQAESIQHPLAWRAVARANAQNPLAIIFPCHRILPYSRNKLTPGIVGGYRGGIWRKEWLLKHEQSLF
jgi:O-6-methylguanine DNA methyltransferase